MHWLRLACCLAWERAGNSNPARTAMTATTTSNSIKLNPWRELLRYDFLSMLVLAHHQPFSSRGSMLISPKKGGVDGSNGCGSPPSDAERMQLQCARQPHSGTVRLAERCSW